VNRALGAVVVLLVFAVFAPSMAAWLTAAVPTLATVLVLLVALRVLFGRVR
jgi:hypothetical protein